MRNLLARDPRVDHACLVDYSLRCYKRAGTCEDLRLQQTALKRQGNAHNVCGQLAITRGDHEGEAKTHFKAALDAFEVRVVEYQFAGRVPVCWHRVQGSRN